MSERTREESFPGLPPRLKPADMLEDFRIEREVATGATATIYEATEISTDRRYALKVLSPHLALVPLAVMRFRAEAALAERVKHRAIIDIRGTGKDRDHYFYAMRLESGETAQSLSLEVDGRERDGFFHAVSRRFADVARALERLHAEGIVHRDVKPENLLVGKDGQLILCDFGSALDTRDRQPALENTLWGTVRYMSPEQLGPEADPYDSSIDTYALGLTLYEVATGVSPFPRCNEEDLVRLKLTRIPPAPRRINFKVPLGLDAIIRQAIEPCIALRHASAAALAEDLERFAERKRGHRR
ncbi:MAG TPA: serine/threonine-protein kinase [Planctomycetota bacterium]|nr:serine/threonine-protein kinase [Planctomycetota bacterium]